jgi:hypothetical protein
VAAPVVRAESEFWQSVGLDATTRDARLATRCADAITACCRFAAGWISAIGNGGRQFFDATPRTGAQRSS